ncbi:MAG TPA: histidine kinase, partial [Pseudonocardiaceae bacterium]|nr:histidine kinase [Pseudonocardiaceae bacterium]
VLSVLAVPVLVLGLVGVRTRWLSDLFLRVTGQPPATPPAWRSLLWLAGQPLVGLPQLLPGAMIAYGGWGLIAQALVNPHRSNWVGQLFGSMWLALLGGAALVLGGLAVAPTLARAHERWLLFVLRPDAVVEELTARVERLTETRAAATDTQAAEVRRIERDLHDGAQARLVAMGMTLGAVEALIDTDPAAAKRLLAQAKDTSAAALAELRGLIRGILPPVLAERGLVDAVRALALDSPLRVDVRAAVDGRATAPVESAAYFAVAEALTNAVRHSGADRVWVELRHDEGALRMTVLDDGGGGADPDRGSGLRGIERRLGSFDGTVTVSSPVGGPTMVTMELPCVLSSPRTSTSSETA